MQNEITEKSQLLDANGKLNQKGWARELFLTYNREDIAASWLRIKEWDYYAVLNADFAITFTIADLGYIGLITVVWLDFQKKDYIQEEQMVLLPRGNFNLPRSSKKGDIKLHKKGIDLEFIRKKGKRHLMVTYPAFDNGKALQADLELKQDPNADSIVIVSDWKEKPTRFYYNQKINCMPTGGTVEIGADEFQFAEDSSFGVLDWGRGVWTYKNTWYWGSASTKIDDTLVGWNLGYGFSDRSKATENAVFYNGKAHKLDAITFYFDDEDFLKPWIIKSNDGRFEMEFTPILDRSSKFNLLLLKSIQHQVFGFYSGYFILDNGKKVEVENVLGFAEEVYNKW
ncbi:MAG: DUF2804 domain-containing protein [Promethearchaeia archaeon]